MATQADTEENVKELKSRMKLICEADPSQYVSEFGLRRYLKAFKDVDTTFQAILKTNKWRKNFGVDSLTIEDPIVADYLKKNVAIISRHRDMHGRPVVYIPAKNHNANDRNIDELTKYMIYTLEEACKRCHEDIIDNLCIVFDLKDFGLQCMDYQFIKNLIWLLSRHYPERLGICIIYNAPIIFSSCWPVIKGWLNEVTASKVVFVNTELELCKYLHPEILPNNV
ncbi:hypothetical protein CHUAL_001567 [Chamberlinius hualienensis]